MPVHLPLSKHNSRRDMTIRSTKDVAFISEFMAPGYLTTGLGFTYDPGKIFTVVLSPASWRGTFVLNDRLSDEGAYGVDPGKHLLSSFGANLKGEVKYEFLKKHDCIFRLDFVF